MEHESDDLDLLMRWTNGSKEAGHELFDRYGTALKSFFATKVPEAADDLTQATLLACLENTERLRERESLRSYLFGIARHLLFQYYRSRNIRRQKHHFNMTSGLDRRPSPSTLVCRSDEDVNLMSALAELPVDMRMLLELTYWENMPASELADVLGVAENTIYSRLHRAKLRLKQALEQLEPR